MTNSNSGGDSPEWLRSFQGHKHTVWSLSSDSEAAPSNSPKKIEGGCIGSKENMDLGLLDDDENDANENVGKVDISCKNTERQVSSSTLPLLLSDKIQYSKALVECEGDSIDLSGDVGAVGRLVITDDQSKNQEMFLDLKGTIYKATIVPSRTFCVVSFGQSEAKIEALTNDFIQLKPLINVLDAETMVEGTLDGFSFNSEDEADHQTRGTVQNEAVEEQETKSKRKTKKTSVASLKTGISATGKSNKKVKRKPHVPKTKK